MTPTNTAPTQVHPIELAIVLMLGLLQQLAWLIRTVAVPLIAIGLAASAVASELEASESCVNRFTQSPKSSVAERPQPSSQVTRVTRVTPNPAPVAASPQPRRQVTRVTRVTPNPAPISVARATVDPAPVSVKRLTLDSAPVGVTRVTPEPPLRPGTVKQLRQQCRDLGLPSKQWRSAKKDTLVQLLAEAPKALEVAAVS